MTQVIKVSKAGIDVGTATNPNDFIFDSEKNTFKIISSGTTSQAITTDPGTITVAHSQSAVPAIFALAKFPDGFVTLPNGIERAGTVPGDPFQRRWIVEVDATNMYFIFNKGTAANYTPTVRYYIFEAPTG